MTRPRLYLNLYEYNLKACSLIQTVLFNNMQQLNLNNEYHKYLKIILYDYNIFISKKRLIHVTQKTCLELV